MTAATPMMTPSMVRPVRSRLRPSAVRRSDALPTANQVSRCFASSMKVRRGRRTSWASRCFRLVPSSCLRAAYSCRSATIGSSWRRARGRVPAEEDAHGAGDAERQEHRHRRHDRRPVAASARSATAAITPRMMPATPPARLIATASTRNCRITSRAARADGQAQADLARPLGHRQQRDVHDADAADQQRHRGHRRQQPAHRPARTFEGAGELLERDLLELARRCRQSPRATFGGSPPVVSARSPVSRS